MMLPQLCPVTRRQALEGGCSNQFPAWCQVPGSVPEQFQLSPEERVLLRKALLRLGDQQGNKQGKLHQLVSQCFVCQRKKHACRWDMRWERSGSRVTGSFCYTCVDSAKKIKCGRNKAVLKAVPSVLAKLAAYSAVRAKAKGRDDSCSCHMCKKGRVPVRRVRSKSTL